VIKATAAVQMDTGAPVTFHPGRHPKAPFEIMRIFLEAGGRPENTIMSHLDRRVEFFLSDLFCLRECLCTRN